MALELIRGFQDLLVAKASTLKIELPDSELDNI